VISQLFFSWFAILTPSFDRVQLTSNKSFQPVNSGLRQSTLIYTLLELPILQTSAERSTVNGNLNWFARYDSTSTYDSTL